MLTKMVAGLGFIISIFDKEKFQSHEVSLSIDLFQMGCPFFLDTEPSDIILFLKKQCGVLNGNGNQFPEVTFTFTDPSISIAFKKSSDPEIRENYVKKMVDFNRSLDPKSDSGLLLDFSSKNLSDKLLRFMANSPL